MLSKAPVGTVRARAFTIPTDAPESDGTLEWKATTLVVAEAEAGGKTGLGWTYASKAAAGVIEETLAEAVIGVDALDVPRAWTEMVSKVRNLGSRGLAGCAISALDGALWDLKARLLGLPLCDLLGRRRDEVEVYGSGGFTSYDERRLADQLGEWTHEGGCAWVKMKVGRHPAEDPGRAKAAKKAIGKAQLFVDANGAYALAQALEMANRFADLNVGWFEEPVSSDDLSGLAFIRERAPAGMAIAAGEYGYEPFYFLRMLEAEAVDVLQADITRCWGITGFLMAADLAFAFNRPLSGHCAPAMHLHAACAAPNLRHLEWFHDHVRIEERLFEGAPKLKRGRIAPDLTRPGNGCDFRRADAERFSA